MVAARLLPADPRDRQRIDRYELVGEIASGGMATVYLARRAGVGGFQRFVAVKRLHPHLATESEFVEMFLDEARLAALIHHPNVVSITEVGASDRGYYLVMDYIEGDTLARLMTDCAEVGRVVPLGVGLRIVIDMLTGLHAAHDLHDEQGHPTELVHRDVSPQNVLVGLDGISRISDFGVARAASRLAGTRVGQLKGKIAYMAPEQAAGDEMLDRRADVFAAGILLWELLTGRRLFRASNDAATLSRVVSEKVEPPTSYVQDLDSRISDVCMQALERPLSRRIASAAEFAELLEAAAARAGVLGSNRDVAAYMQSVLGEEATRQREAVRRWISDSDIGETALPSQISRSIPPSQPRHDRISTGFERSPSSSRTRAVHTRSLHDSDPHDLTQVAPRPRNIWLVAALITLALAGTVLALSFAARPPSPRAAAWPQSSNVVPMLTRAMLVQRAALSERQRGVSRDNASSPRTAWLDSPDVHFPTAAPLAMPKGAKPPATAASARVAAPVGVSDVDLSNPYR